MEYEKCRLNTIKNKTRYSKNTFKYAPAYSGILICNPTF